jgi:hypothetical protein
MKESGRVLIWVHIMEFAWRDWVKPQKQRNWYSDRDFITKHSDVLFGYVH